MNKTIKTTLFLAIIALISGLSIGLVNNFTAPIIEKNALNAEKENLKLLFPTGEFSSIDYKDEEEVILGAYKVNGQGYIFKASAVGYNSSNPIIVLIGMSEEGTITGVVPLQQQETSGVGSKCFDDENINKLYVGKTIKEEVDTLSGATFTSNAMKIMCAKAQEAFGKVK